MKKARINKNVEHQGIGGKEIIIERELTIDDILDFIFGDEEEDMKSYEDLWIAYAGEENENGVVKIINSYPLSIPKADKLILLFKNECELGNIDCDISFLYCTYPALKVINE